MRKVIMNDCRIESAKVGIKGIGIVDIEMDRCEFRNNIRDIELDATGEFTVRNSIFSEKSTTLDNDNGDNIKKMRSKISFDKNISARHSWGWTSKYGVNWNSITWKKRS